MKRLYEKHPLFIRWCHWLNVPILAVMVWSGALIYWADQAYVKIPHAIRVERPFAAADPPRPPVSIVWDLAREPSDKPEPLLRFAVHHRLAEGMAWHFAFGWLFALNGLLFAGYAVRGGHWRELLPHRRSGREALSVIWTELRLKKARWSGKYNGAQRFAYTLVMLMGVGSVLTGLAIYKPWQLGWLSRSLGGYEAARLEHFLLTCGLVGFTIIHVGQVSRYGWNCLRSMITGYDVEPAPEEAPPNV